MAQSKRVVHLDQSPAEALGACARAMVAAGFRNVHKDDTAKMVTAEKRVGGQRSKGTIAAFVEPAQTGEGTKVTVRSDANAYSLVSMFASPSERLIERFLTFLKTI